MHVQGMSSAAAAGSSSACLPEAHLRSCLKRRPAPCSAPRAAHPRRASESLWPPCCSDRRRRAGQGGATQLSRAVKAPCRPGLTAQYSECRAPVQWGLHYMKVTFSTPYYTVPTCVESPRLVIHPAHHRETRRQSSRRLKGSRLSVQRLLRVPTHLDFHVMHQAQLRPQLGAIAWQPSDYPWHRQASATWPTRSRPSTDRVALQGLALA